mgnify:FL=1
MEYVIILLEENKKWLERHVRNSNLMKTDIQQAAKEMQQIGQLKRAIKILKQKIKSYDQ